MPAPEEQLSTLIDHLDGLARGDRKAILKRLSGDERALMRKHMQGDDADRTRSPFSSDIAALITAADAAPLTGAARAALARAATSASPTVPRSETLLDAATRLFRLPGASA